MKCKICHITQEEYKLKTGNNFYDSGVYTDRPLCSKECYSKMFDDMLELQKVANVVKKEYRKQTPEARAIYKQTHKKAIAQKDKEYYAQHEEKIRAYQKAYRERKKLEKQI